MTNPIDTPYTAHRELEFRGPSTSDLYNERIEENYKDLIVLTNRARITQADLNEAYARLVKDQLALVTAIEDLENRINALEDDNNQLTFQHADQVDTDRFNGTSFEVVAANKLDINETFGIVTLPKVTGAGISKLIFSNSDGTVVIPSTFETNVVGVTGTADSSGAIIDTSEPDLAVAHKTGRIWQRNVIVGSQTSGGAQLYLYIKVPTDLFSSANSNGLILYPFPALGTDILEIAVSTAADIMMQDSDGYTPLNANAIHDGDHNAIGWLPPGGWVGDTAYNSGPRLYYFDPTPITGLRIKLGQRNFLTEGSHVVYSYGLSNLDLRWEKFLSQGTGMIRFDAPEGKTISQILSVEPQIWNVSESDLPNVFTYDTIWETSFNSGTYTTTPVPNSLRVWIRVNLTMTTGGGTPALSGLTFTYS